MTEKNIKLGKSRAKAYFTFLFQASLMGVTTTTIPSYEPVRRDSFRPASLEAADNSLALTSSLSPVDEQVSVNLTLFQQLSVKYILI